VSIFKNIFKKKSEENPYNGLRMLALEVNGDENGFNHLNDDDPYKALVEFCVSGTPVSVFASLDGTASIYFSSGGGYIGGGQNSESIANLAKYLVSGIRDVIPQLHVTKEFTLPRIGEVNYFGVTRNGVYYYKGSEEQARKEACLYYQLYYLSQYIIADYRKIQEK